MHKEQLKGKTKASFFAVLIIIVLAAGIYGIWYIKEESGAVSEEEIVLEEGQYLQYAQINTITGNEIVYTKIEYTELETSVEGENNYPQLGKPAGSENDYMKLEKPMEAETGYPELEKSIESKNDNSKLAIPSENETDYLRQNDYNWQAEAENMPERQHRQASKKNADEQMQESSQLQIPVGTEVITKLGTVTTFSRLASGNTVKMLMQKLDGNEDTVLKIWIIE